MAQQDVSIAIKAKDEASAAVGRVAREFIGLKGSIDAIGAMQGVLAFAGIGAAAAGAALGVYKLSTSLAQSVEEMDLVRGTTGATLAQVQVLRRAFENTGLGAQRADMMLAYMSKSMGQNSKVLKDMGITTRDAFEGLMQFAEKLSEVSDAGNRAAVLQAVLGKSWKDGSRALQNLRGQLDEISGVYKRFGALLTDDVAGGAYDLDARLDNLNTTLDALKTAFALRLVPAVTATIEELDALIAILTKLGNIPGIKEALQMFGEALDDIRPTRVKAEFDELAARIKVVEIAFRDGEKAARDFAAAQGLGQFRGFGGGSSGGKGGGASWAGGDGTKGSKTYETGMVVVGEDEDGNPIFGYSPKKTGKGAAADPREKRLEDIRSLLRVSAADAAIYLGILEDIETKARANKLMTDVFGVSMDAGARRDDIQLRDPSMNAEDITARIMRPQTDPLKVSAPVLELQRQLEEKQRALLATFPAMSEAMIEVGITWGETVDSVLSASAILNDGFAALWDGLQSGFSTVFANLGNKAQTFRGAMKTIFSALVQEILAMLARMAAAQVFKIALSLATGVPTVAIMPSPGLDNLPLPTATVGPPGMGTASANGGTTVININAINARDVALAMMSPRGEFRRAEASLSLAGAY